MPIFTERHPCFIEAWVSQPGLVIDRGPDCDPLVLPSEITRHGKVYPVRDGDYVYLDRDGNWDACPKKHFESAYVLDDDRPDPEVVCEMCEYSPGAVYQHADDCYDPEDDRPNLCSGTGVHYDDCRGEWIPCPACSDPVAQSSDDGPAHGVAVPAVVGEAGR